MIKWLCLLIMLPCFASSQKVNYTASVEYRNQGDIKSGYGLNFGVHFPVAKIGGAGLSVSGVKFQELKDTYYPLMGSVFVRIPAGDLIRLRLVGEAGYGVYKYTNNKNTLDRYTIKGGFTYAAGALLGIKTSKKIVPFVFAGYTFSKFTSTHVTQYIGSDITTVTENNYGGLLLRLGVNF
jgi:hypothetical protein